MPRYGWETKERIITPDEIYNKEIATVMMKNTIELLIKSCEFYRLRDMDGILASKIKEIEESCKKNIRPVYGIEKQRSLKIKMGLVMEYQSRGSCGIVRKPFMYAMHTN